MKLIPTLLLATIVSFATASCGNTEEGSSTPIDSTNLHGTAPATYGDDTSNHPVYEGNMDTTDRLPANTASSEDSAKGRAR
jgi:hypothetical protein